MMKRGQTPRLPCSDAHLLEGFLSKEPRKRAIELAFLGRLLHGATAGATTAKGGNAGSAEARDIENEVTCDFADYQNSFVARLAGALELLQGGDVAFGPFKGAKALRTVVGAQLEESGPSPFIEDMIHRGELLDSATFAAKLKWTQPRLTREVNANHVFSIKLTSPRYFPAFYADDKYDRDHLTTVTQALGDLPGTAKFLFFTQRKGSLGGMTPLEAIGHGKLAKVLDIAEAYRDA